MDMEHVREALLNEHGFVMNAIMHIMKGGRHDRRKVRGLCDYSLIFSPDKEHIYEYILPAINIFKGLFSL